MAWVDAIAHLYGLNAVRLQAPRGSAEYAACDAGLRQAVRLMAEQHNTALNEATLCEPAAKVLRSMASH